MMHIGCQRFESCTSHHPIPGLWQSTLWAGGIRPYVVVMTQFVLRRYAKVEVVRLLRAELRYRWRALISGPHFRRRQYTSPLYRQSDT